VQLDGLGHEVPALADRGRVVLDPHDASVRPSPDASL
jgi:hypothetical protein